METNWVDANLLEPRLNADFYRANYVANALRREHIQCRSLEKLCKAGRRITNGVRGPELAESDYRMLRIQDLDSLFFDSSNALRISERQYQENRRAWCKQGDILVSIGGELRLAGIVIDDAPQVIGRHTGLIPIDRKLIENEFLLAYLCSNCGKLDLARYMAGTAQLGIDLDDLREIRVPIPHSSIQIAIAQKIQKVRKLREFASIAWNQAVGQLQQSLCVDLAEDRFDRFTASDLKSSEYTCLTIQPAVAMAKVTEELAAQYFHPRRVHARRVARRAERADSLSSVASRVSRGSGTNGGFVGLDAIDSSTGVVDRASISGSGDETGCSRFSPNDILFSRLRPYLNKVAIWPSRQSDGRGSGEFLVYRPQTIDPYYLFFVIRSTLGLHQVIDVTAGSTHPRVDAAVVDQMLIPRLDESDEAKIGATVARAHSFWYESQELLPEAKRDVECLLDGTLDQRRLLERAKEISAWLESNFAPSNSGMDNV